jgi:hypothetical protein
MAKSLEEESEVIFMHTINKKRRLGGWVKVGRNLYNGTWFVSFEKGGVSWFAEFASELEAINRYAEV